MDVILREDYLALGYIGDTVKVRRGFARNFLIPRGIAVEASATNDRLLQHQLGAILAKRRRKKTEAEEFGKIISQVIVEFTLKVGEQGKSFGSVTAREIEGKLKELGYTIDRKQIRVADPIRSVGSHTVEVKLHAEVVVPLQIKVLAEKSLEPVADETGDTKIGKKTDKKKRQAPRKTAGKDESTGEDVEESADA